MGRARAEQRYKEQLQEQAARQRYVVLSPAPASSSPVVKAPPADGPVAKAPPADVPVAKAHPSPCSAESAVASNAMPPEIEFAMKIGVSLPDLMAATTGVDAFGSVRPSHAVYTQVKAPLSVPPIHTIGKPHFGNPPSRLEHGQAISAQAREERLKAQAKPPPPMFKADGPPPKAAAAPVDLQPECEPFGKVAPPYPAVPPQISRHDKVDMQRLEDYNREEREHAAARAAARALCPQVKMPPPHVVPPLANMVPQLKAPPQAKLKAIPPLASAGAAPATPVVNEITPKPPPILVCPPVGKAHFVGRNMHLVEFSGSQPPATKGPPPWFWQPWKLIIQPGLKLRWAWSAQLLLRWPTSRR